MEYSGKFWSNKASGDIEIQFHQSRDPEYPNLQEINLVFSYTGRYRNGAVLDLWAEVETPVTDFWINIDENELSGKKILVRNNKVHEAATRKNSVVENQFRDIIQYPFYK